MTDMKGARVKPMKKQERIDLINYGMVNKEICRCYFSYDPAYFYCYPNEVNDKFVMGQEEDDFLLDGYFIRKISQLTKVEIKTDKCGQINRMLGIAEQVVHPGVDISNWRTIFESLARMDTYVIIEDAINTQFAIGVIEKVLKDRIYFKRFDANGVWYEDSLEIRYSQITGVEWGTRYDIQWKMFLERT